ncbi:DNA-directed RNA polymerase subunit delta [Thermoflavimicrobium dichotomicum]|uniref:Probable DNA-directed RNA polymerase subunit delta n=1 Tax=Thermoflavimicrobium dichotomicum TaxID=46223 RepID=A0A1I3K5H7_9BACL|nr:DNA-directed RNA polymerase subunit delta [Thermoflavimicrobium dichotomicum]SFI67712.1 DNA-directed RNA polymerase subunit delta [Thermoflavimicrobium dichotomicum]
MLSDNLTMEKIMETSMVDIAYDLLKQKGEPMQYLDLMKEIANLKGFAEEEINQYIAQLYTDINIDGRFVCVGRSLWGIKDWYPTEQTTDSAVVANIKEYDDELDEELYEESDDYDLELDDLDRHDLDDFDEETPFPDDLEEDDIVADDEDEDEL